MIDWNQVQTAEQRAKAAARRAYEQALEQRRAAYQSESDPLRLEAEYDAMVSGTAPDYSAWQAKVAEIKARIPLPPKPED